MKKNKKIAVFGCKKTTKFLIENLLKIYPIDFLITINSNLGRKNQVADYYDLYKFAKEKGIKVYRAKDYSLKSEGDINYINSLNIDVAFVAGWQRLIPVQILEKFNIGAFGMHGSSMNLPLGRGRSPLNWSIIENRKNFYTNLFKYDAGIDSGDIVDTVKFAINNKDTAKTLHFKNILAMCCLVEKNLPKILSGALKLKKQRNIKPTYYPKRSPEDGLIDWGKDVFCIERFIRAVTRPFDGAFSYIDGKKIVIFNAQFFDENKFGLRNMKFGKIVKILSEDCFLISCRGGLLLVTDFVFEGKLKEKMICDNNGNKIKKFKLNKLGYHDIYKN